MARANPSMPALGCRDPWHQVMTRDHRQVNNPLRLVCLPKPSPIWNIGPGRPPTVTTMNTALVDISNPRMSEFR